MVNQDTMEEKESQISQFYNDKTVFITGATGFMGKVLVEKLLRSTKVKKIYLLIRQKKGLQTKVRLQELMSAKIFDELKERSADVMSRIEAFSGDITEHNFGLSEEDERRMIEEVNIVFHSAATINFDEDLTKAVNLNVVAVFTLMEICKKMKNLQALVHVSTAYCNPQLKNISEEINPENGDPVGIIDLCQRMDPSILNRSEMTAKIIGNKPNTYTFTKALGESALVSEGGCLPIAIVRPSIVVAAWKEPLPGWLENLNGPTGAIAGAGKGLLRTVYCKREKIADLVPVDIPINLAIAVAWKTASQPSNAIPVYNCTSGSINPISWGQLETLTLASIRKYPMERVLRYPGGSYNEYAWVHRICQIALHSAPAYLMDTVACVMGKKQVMMRLVEKMHKAQKAVEYFATNEWKWSNDNMIKLNLELTEVDKKTFNFDLSTLNWPDFIDDYVKGTRQYVFKEDLATLDEARRHSNKMFWIEKCVQILLFIIFGKLLVSMFS
eukprot:GFUD01039944.1.p1 GENE.GFUD01039944.1~~GFUD01039944.1.p1  ORF type:complete len:515 (+),score=130.04 GFUD01039944.1:51-1547(+)